MEGDSGDSESDYMDCVTDRSRSSSEEVEDQGEASVGTREMASAGARGRSGRDDVQRAPTVRRFRRIDNHRRTAENADKASSESKQAGDGFAIRGYELRAPHNTHALKRLSLDATLQRQEFLRTAEARSQSMRSKVQDEVMKVLFGPPDAKTPDEEKYEIVEQEEVVRGVGRTGILFRFSMWATMGFIALVLGGRRAHVGCSEFFPTVRERDPVPKVTLGSKYKYHKNCSRICTQQMML